MYYLNSLGTVKFSFFSVSVNSATSSIYAEIHAPYKQCTKRLGELEQNIPTLTPSSFNWPVWAPEDKVSERVVIDHFLRSRLAKS